MKLYVYTYIHIISLVINTDLTVDTTIIPFTDKEIEARRLIFRSYIVSIHQDFQ